MNDCVDKCLENEKLFDCDYVVARDNHFTEIFLADSDFSEKLGYIFEPAAWQEVEQLIKSRREKAVCSKC